MRLTIGTDELQPVFVSDSTHRHYNLRRADAGGGHGYSVAIARQTEQGTGEAQSLAHDLIEDLAPSLLLVVGIAGAPPSSDLTLGDVLISTRVNDYSVHASTPTGTEYAMSGGPIAAAIARGVANLPARKTDLGSWWNALPTRPPVVFDDPANYTVADPEWSAKVKGSLARHFRDKARQAPLFVAGVLGSSDALVKDSAPLLAWLKTARHLLGVEMEAAGVYRAATARCAMLAIRGISDVVGFKRDEEWTAYACASAAYFTRAYLRTTPVKPRTGSFAPSSIAQSTGSVAPVPSPGAAPVPLTVSEPPEARPPLEFLPSVASLQSRAGTPVQPLLWLLRLEPAHRIDATKAELSKAAEASILAYDLNNYQRQGHWPRVLQLAESRRSLTTDGGHLSSHPYRTDASNECGDEQFFLARNGAVSFQRSTFWDNETIALDFGYLGLDTLLFLVFCGRYLKRLSVEQARVQLLVHSPKVTPPVVAHFNYPPLESEDSSCIARLSIADIRTESSVSRAGLTDRTLVTQTTKRLLDGIANEFAQEQSAFASRSAPFMSISEESVAGLYERLLGRLL